MRAITIVSMSLGAALLASPNAQACTTVPSLPYRITSSGSYCLTGALTYDPGNGYAIEIAADSVVLDLGGFGIAGSSGLDSTATGIYAADRQHLVIRNGYVSGFLYGMRVTGGESHLVEDIRATDNWYIGLWVGGVGTVVRSNQVVNTGHSSRPDSTIPIGIKAEGAGVQVLDNVVASVVPPDSGEAIGVHVSDGAGGRVEGNSISNPSVIANTWGVWVNSEQLLVKANHFARMANGIAFPSGSSGVYRDNTTVDVASPYSGGLDAGGNH